MKVFISSVTYLLKEERAALVPFLRLFDHEPLRFEDFSAQDRSSREACLAGVEAADVYVLLLGPRYGQPFVDTGLSPTAEEFKRARQRSIPILVFNKVLEEADEAAQSAFKDEVGHYVNGRFWRSFTDPVSCNQAVGESLKGVRLQLGPAERSTPPGPLEVPWLREVGLLASGSGPQMWTAAQRESSPPFHLAAPAVEMHVVGTGATGAPSRRQLEVTATELAREARTVGFVSDGDELAIGGSDAIAWAVRPPAATSSRDSAIPYTVERFRGVLVHRSGSVGAFKSLNTDMMGALVNASSLQADFAEMFGLVSHRLPRTESVSAAVGLINAGRVWEGDPGTVGDRSSGRMRLSERLEIRVGADFVVPGARLRESFGDIGKDLAHDVLTRLRDSAF